MSRRSFFLLPREFLSDSTPHRIGSKCAGMRFASAAIIYSAASWLTSTLHEKYGNSKDQERVDEVNVPAGKSEETKPQRDQSRPLSSKLINFQKSKKIFARKKSFLQHFIQLC
ncbi:hypothetical protein PUN28_001071 [Cardiocondyla obscurior]|uniref:Uncharacterized protein n=1 Tax=Cardiocondyla obscurior TaxID=286306 RepID=A0AAW2H2S2_9HYME